MNDYKCLTAIKIAVNNKEGDLKVYKKVINTMTELINQHAKVRTMDSSSDENVQQDKYREDLFSMEDFLFYRGIGYFYSKNYQEAANDFEASIVAKREAAILTIPVNRSQSACDSIDTDLSDVGLCTVNVNEYHFNIVLCYIMVSLCFIHR